MTKDPDTFAVFVQEVAELEMAKASLNTELGTARGEVEALGKVVAQRASEAEDLKRSRAEASEGEERLQREIESVRSECDATTEASAAREESLR